MKKKNKDEGKDIKKGIVKGRDKWNINEQKLKPYNIVIQLQNSSFNKLVNNMPRSQGSLENNFQWTEVIFGLHAGRETSDDKLVFCLLILSYEAKQQANTLFYTFCIQCFIVSRVQFDCKVNIFSKNMYFNICFIIGVPVFILLLLISNFPYSINIAVDVCLFPTVQLLMYH